MSLEDVIKLMKAQKTDQKAELEEMFEKQRVGERKEREKEKINLIKELRVGIKEEIQAEMKPLEERTAQVEKSTETIGNQMAELVNKVKTLEDQLQDVKEKSTRKSYTDVVKEKHFPEHGEPELKMLDKNKKEESEGNYKVKEILRSASKVIGLKPIDKLHVEHIQRRLKENMENENDEDLWKAALQKAVEMFLDKEMRIRGEDYEQLNIVKIFPPAKGDWNVLYVEFENKKQADFVYTFTQYMRRNVKGDGKPEVQIYVPKQLYARFSAINLMAFKIREASGKSISTRVTLGKNDLILQQRSKSDKSQGWGEALPLPEDLPDFELNMQRGPLSPGEAPGRSPFTPEQKDCRKRKGRSSSGSPESSKSPPTKRPESDVTCSVKTPPTGLGLLRRPDVGSVTNVQGYSTPIRQQHDGNTFSPIIGSPKSTKQ